MQLGSMFISNGNNTLHVSGAICVHPQETCSFHKSEGLPSHLRLLDSTNAISYLITGKKIINLSKFMNCFQYFTHRLPITLQQE
jgi:hypothetical protein